MLYEMVQKAQAGEQNEMMDIVSKFSGLIKKWGRKLGYEDATNDLIADFIDLVYHLKLEKLKNTSDGAIVNFICRSIYRLYLKRLKDEIEGKATELSLEDLTPVQIQRVYNQTATELQDSISSYFPEVGLSRKERIVLTAIYEDGYSVSEIAACWGVSRQNVNQIKNRAVEKLKKSYF